ncbi:hypothetical protein Tco_1294802 [Tanacetum coccineum]
MLVTRTTTMGGWQRMITYLESSRLWWTSRWSFLQLTRLPSRWMCLLLRRSIDSSMIDMVETGWARGRAEFVSDDNLRDDASNGFSEVEVSDAGVASGVTIREIGLRVYAVEGQVRVVVSQIAHAVDIWEQIEVHQRDMQIQQLQTIVSEMSSRESSLMQCILGLDKRIAALERRPPGPP